MDELAALQSEGVNGAAQSPRPESEAERGYNDEPSFEDIDWKERERQDAEEIKRLMDPEGNNMTKGIGNFGDRDIDQTNKADDAVDFEDISDDDLASDGGLHDPETPDARPSQVPGLTDDSGTSPNEIDDLFGDDGYEQDHIPSPSAEKADQLSLPIQNALDAPKNRDRDRDRELVPPSDQEWKGMSMEERMAINFPSLTAGGEENINGWIDEQSRNLDDAMHAPPQSIEELLQREFPSYRPDQIPYLNEVFPEWPANYIYKEPPKSPGEFVPTKLELELDGDGSKLFRIPDNVLTATERKAQQGHGNKYGLESLVFNAAEDPDDLMSDDGQDSDEELVGGFKLSEIATVCDDWETAIQIQPSPKRKHDDVAVSIAVPDEEDDMWTREIMQDASQEPPAKRLKYEKGLPDISTFKPLGVDHFLEATHHFARNVQLDLNDPYIMVDQVEQPKQEATPHKAMAMKRMANGQLGRDVRQRFNISNDEAYDALKVNHKSKVRATLSNLSVEHSLPALKLTFPFYRTKAKNGLWEHHRQKIEVEKAIKQSIPARKALKQRRKELKGRSVQEIFRTTKDLSLNDNSSAVLFEYSEQFPILLSNFGMGSRVINYYRRKEKTDEEKAAKLELGEPHFLLPEDRSPFSIFGTVNPGETVPTLHNEMYRAPIFKHEPRQTDFICGYQTNVADGPRFYLRNIDHLYVVGQTFPSVEVPGPHARKITNTFKNRLKMISYRLMKKSSNQDLDIKRLTPSVFEHPDPQNRQKMKEFLEYNKESRTWVLKHDDIMPDTPAIRSMIKPEDVCLVEATQIGDQLLVNAGYDPKNADTVDENDEDGAEEPLVAKMAPWQLTKNFIDASAGKAMVALHGEGDPTGHGLGFSFIKTSMKGGYINAVQGPLATSADAIERERKANGGHSYNVRKQQDMYNAAIQEIWGRQKSTLSDATTHEDADVLDTANEDDRFNPRRQSEAATPAANFADDGRSQLSRLSGASRLGRKRLKIIRERKNSTGEIEQEIDILEDPAIIRNYMKRRKDLEEARRNVYELRPTGDADDNRKAAELVQKELDRLLKNQDRRQAREKQGKGKRKKGVDISTSGDVGSPDPSGSADKAAGGTTRKCANCGQVGHIKTNKSKCPLLNGTIQPNANAVDHGGFGSFNAPSAASPAPDSSF